MGLHISHIPVPEPMMEDMETLADYSTLFSLAGIREVQDEVERGKIVINVRLAKGTAPMHGGQP
jgi:hypothetical protein